MLQQQVSQMDLNKFVSPHSTNLTTSLIWHPSVSVSCQLNWACNFVVGILFPYLQEYLGAFSFLPFAVILLVTFIFASTVLPETKGTTPEDLRDEIVRSLSTMLVLSNDNTVASSVGNPIDVEWRRAMSDLRRLEEEDMKRGTYSESAITGSLLTLLFAPAHMFVTARYFFTDYGFQPIEQNPVAAESDWRARVAGDTSR